MIEEDELTIKVNQIIAVLKSKYKYVPSMYEAHIDNLGSDILEALTVDQATYIIRAMQKAYQNGKESAQSEKIDIDTVWVNGVGMIERAVDGTWKLIGEDSSQFLRQSAASLLGKSKSAAKSVASRENGKRGGRPRKDTK